MRLFGKLGGGVDRQDRGPWMLSTFTLSWLTTPRLRILAEGTTVVRTRVESVFAVSGISVGPSTTLSLFDRFGFGGVRYIQGGGGGVRAIVILTDTVAVSRSVAGIGKVIL